MNTHAAGRTLDTGETALPLRSSQQNKLDRAAVLARDAAIVGKEAARLAVHENTVEGRKQATRLASQAGSMAWDAAFSAVDVSFIETRDEDRKIDYPRPSVSESVFALVQRVRGACTDGQK